MDYYFVYCDRTETVHIIADRWGEDKTLCQELYVNGLQKVTDPMNENNARCEAALMMNKGYNVCGNCVRNLYKNR